MAMCRLRSARLAVALAAEPRAQLLAGGGAHSNARDLSHSAATLSQSEDAAAKWRQRNPFDEDRIRILLADDARPHSKVTWQPNGQGQKPRRSSRADLGRGALRRAALSSFPAGLRCWQVEQLTGGQPAPLRQQSL